MDQEKLARLNLFCQCTLSSIEDKKRKTQNPKEKGSISVLQRSVIDKINQIGYIQFLLNLEKADYFIENELKIGIQEATKVLQKYKEKFGIETSRAFNRQKETRIMAMAVYYDSWAPLLRCATIYNKVNNSQVQVQVYIPEGTEYVDQNGKTNTLEKQYFIISCKTQKNSVQATQPFIPTQEAQPSFPTLENETTVSGMDFDIFNEFDDQFSPQPSQGFQCEE